MSNNTETETNYLNATAIGAVPQNSAMELQLPGLHLGTEHLLPITEEDILKRHFFREMYLLPDDEGGDFASYYMHLSSNCTVEYHTDSNKCTLWRKRGDTHSASLIIKDLNTLDTIINFFRA